MNATNRKLLQLAGVRSILESPCRPVEGGSEGLRNFDLVSDLHDCHHVTTSRVSRAPKQLRRNAVSRMQLVFARRPYYAHKL
jgi:hypothetical protein